jgi:hypothetical protein
MLDLMCHKNCQPSGNVNCVQPEKMRNGPGFSVLYVWCHCVLYFVSVCFIQEKHKSNNASVSNSVLELLAGVSTLGCFSGISGKE